jgi:hypothetical protein
LDRARLLELLYIAPISNVRSIASRGLLSYRRAARHQPDSIALPAVQERRESASVPSGRPLHEYVNLYVNARNPMLYLRSRQDHESLCVLRVNPAVLELPDVVVTLENAARSLVRFWAPDEGIAALEEEVVFARYWTYPGDPVAEYRHKGAMCAEVLVPDRIPAELLVGAYVACRPAEEAFDSVQAAIPGAINRDMFFGVCQA